MTENRRDFARFAGKLECKGLSHCAIKGVGGVLDLGQANVLTPALEWPTCNHREEALGRFNKVSIFGKRKRIPW